MLRDNGTGRCEAPEAKRGGDPAGGAIRPVSVVDCGAGGAPACRAEAPAGAGGVSRRTALRAALAALLAALPLLAGCSGGWGVVAQSMLDRVTPGPWVTMWACTPQPDSYVDSYADATGAGDNYVYRVDAATADGDRRELTVIAFGAKASGKGYLEIEAKGGSGVRYRAVAEEDVPAGALAALDRSQGV